MTVEEIVVTLTNRVARADADKLTGWGLLDPQNRS